jgi:NTE family protein
MTTPAPPVRASAASSRASPCRLAPRRWFARDAAVQGLADQLAAAAPFDRPLSTIVTGPQVVLGSTDLVFGVDWTEHTATSDLPASVGSYRAGRTLPDPGWRLADSCATSCAIPPWFAPRVVPGALGRRLNGGQREAETHAEHLELRRHLLLTDGGVYDNLGLEPVWRNHLDVLVSDGGGVFRAATQRTVIGRLARSLEVLGRSGSNTRLRWLHAAFAREVLGGATWGVDDAPAEGYPVAVVEQIARVRTDLDAFSPAEQQVLERHGYLTADAALRRHAAHLVRRPVPLDPPHPEVADPAVALAALAGSERRTVLGRR